MGEIADGLINGEFDYHTGEYIGKPVGYPRTLASTPSKEIHKIRKELNTLKLKLISEGTNKNKALNDAKATINKTYGHGWREQY